MHKYLTLLLSILLAILSGCAGNTQQPAVNVPSNPVINNAARTASSIEQPRGPAGVSNRIINGRRVALVIGNANYTDPAWPRLRNAVNDANDIAQDLQRFGFEVLKGLDLNKQQMSEKIAAFGRKAGNAEVALFYYAGHGVQIKNHNYLIPMGVSNLSPSYVEAESINLSFPLNEMDDANSKIKIAILDACRTSVPGSAFRGGLSRSGVKDGFAAPDAMVAGTVIVYASAPGKVAADGTGRNGLFTEGLRVALAQKKANLNLDEVLTTASRWVEQKSAGRQTPYVNGPQTLKADFYLAGSAAAEARQAELERQRVEAAKIAKPDPRIAELEARAREAERQAQIEKARRLEAERQAQAAKVKTASEVVKVGIKYQVGDWYLFRDPDDGDVYLWYYGINNAITTAIEIVRDSGGWYKIIRNNKILVVYSSGRTRNRRAFYKKPWKKNRLAKSLASFGSFSISGTEGITYFKFSQTTITITLPNKGKIVLNTDSPLIQFTSSLGRRKQFEF